MELLYRTFFFTVSMALLMALTLPVVLIARFFMRRHRRKYVLWLWRLIYLRSICPLAMTSLLFVAPGLNHYYHLILSRLGFTMGGVNGIMFHWSDIFKRHITVSAAFKACSFIWAAGVVILLMHLILTQRNLRTYFASAEGMGENIYESSAIELPVQLGILHKKLYLPRGYQTRETAWLLRHMEARRMEPLRRFLVVLITVIYWINPVMWLYYYLWSQDNEISADERIVYRRPDKFRLQYAQGILNFRKSQRYVKDASGKYVEKKSPNIFSLLTIFERKPERRARRVMYQKWFTSGRKLSALFWLFLACFLLFFLSPLHRLWANQGRANSSRQDRSAESLFEDGKNLVVAKASAQSPSGLKRVIQLEMRSGSEDGSGGYDGKFSLVMYDNIENKIDSIDMDDVFSKSTQKKYHFTAGMALQVHDYNGDNVQEITLGQKQALTEKEFDKLFEGKDKNKKPKLQNAHVLQFTLINIEEKELQAAQEGITFVSLENGPNESALFETVEGVRTVFGVPMGKETQYYQWNQESGEYEPKNYTTKEVEQLKKEENNETGQAKDEAQDHTLERADGETAILVSTKRDSTSSEEIQSVTLSPRSSQIQFRDVQGYYCDLLWVTAPGDEAEQYAQVIYNGTKARTFVVYDTKRKTVYYRQEDGTKTLADLFKKYNENDISFSDQSAAIYSLKEKNNDTLKIEFSAEAEGDITVKGSYEYNVKEKKSANLSYTRIVTPEEPSAEPTAEPKD